MALRMQSNKDMKGITIQIYEKHHSIKNLNSNAFHVFILEKKNVTINGNILINSIADFTNIYILGSSDSVILFVLHPW
jgi:hypothetical protein